MQAVLEAQCAEWLLELLVGAKKYRGNFVILFRGYIKAIFLESVKLSAGIINRERFCNSAAGGFYQRILCCNHYLFTFHLFFTQQRIMEI